TQILEAFRFEFQSLNSFQGISIPEFFEFSALRVDTLRWLGSLASLRYLGMNQVDMSMLSVNSLRVLNRLSFLTELHFSGCSLSGFAPSLRPSNLTSLAVVDLSSNNFDSMFSGWDVNLSSLVYLDLSSSGLQWTHSLWYL
ncbi:hypothetical protein IFM89_027344, partial [Coptis chinensis]